MTKDGKYTGGCCFRGDNIPSVTIAFGGGGVSEHVRAGTFGREDRPVLVTDLISISAIKPKQTNKHLPSRRGPYFPVTSSGKSPGNGKPRSGLRLTLHR